MEPPAADARRRATATAFAATLGASAFLLFVAQPMLARMALPRLGGLKLDGTELVLASEPAPRAADVQAE